MPTTRDPTYVLSDFASLLADLNQQGFEFAVIGGIAVGAYGRATGTTLLSGDLDLYTDPRTLRDILSWSRKRGIEVLKPPHVRGLDVALLRWDGKPFDVLSSSKGLPRPAEVIRNAREFSLAGTDLDVPVADPFDLLANKLAVNREKDQPHIAVLKHYIELEVEKAFTHETNGRRRIGPATRYLNVLGRSTLPPALAHRLMAVADHPACFRFLAGRIPDASFAPALVRRPTDPATQAVVADILVDRFPRAAG